MATTVQQQDWEYAREIGTPFNLQLASGQQLACTEILRLLPGRRLVCRAMLDGATVLVKLFIGASSQQEYDEDLQGVQALARAEVPTPALLSQDIVQDKSYPVLIFAFLEHAREFKDVWQEEDQQSYLLEQLLQMVAKQHAAGLRQRDFHLKNFLVAADGQVVAIDGGDYALGQVSSRMVLHNLGMLFGHLPREILLDTPAWVQVYSRARGGDAGQLALSTVLRSADRFRRKRASRISRKAYRNCSEFVVRKYGAYRVYHRRSFNAGLLDRWLDGQGIIDISAQDDLLKPGNSQTVWRTDIGNHKIVVKRYNLKSWMHAGKRLVTRSRASRSWENAFRLRAYHIVTPEPLAMIEERIGPFRRRAWLLTEWCAGVSAKKYLREAEDSTAVRQDMQRLAKVVYRLDNNGIVHGDLKATNFLIDEERVNLIDLDSMSFPVLSWSQRRGIDADQQRFLLNWAGVWLLPVFERLLGKHH